MSDPTAPYCNVAIATPPADPAKPKPIQMIPPGSSIQNAIHIINNNFINLVKGNFHEDRTLRQTVITRIFDSADPSVFVDVKQITGSTWVNGITGQTLTWRQ